MARPSWVVRRRLARERRRADPAHLTGAELRSGWEWARSFPHLAGRVLSALWRTRRQLVLLGLVATAVVTFVLSLLGVGGTEIWEILTTLALGALVVAVSREHRTVGACVLAVLLLSLVGTLAGPRWSPVSLSATLSPTTSSTLIGGQVQTPQVGTYEVVTTTVSIPQADGGQVPALLRQPQGVTGPTRGVVFLHGAGTHTQEGFAEQAQALASAGVTTLVPSKPMEDYSLTERDYLAMARDYEQSVRYLQGLEGVDPGGVGLYAESEGDFPGVVLASEEQGVAFLVLASAPVVELRQQASFAAATYLSNVGVPEPLLRIIPRVLGSRELPGGGFDYADFDARPYERRITVPVLMMYGTGDSSMPLVQGPEVMREALDAAGNSSLTVRYYEGANHGLKLGASTDGPLAPGVARDLSRWVGGLPTTATASPQVAGDTPVQELGAVSPGATRWYASGDLMLLSLILGVVMLAASGVLWALGQLPRLMGRPGLHLPGPLGQWTAAVALAVLSSWVLYLAYLVAVARLALSYTSNPWVSYGGWWVAQVMALVSVVMLVKLVARAWQVRSQERGGRDPGGRWLTLPSAAVLTLAVGGAFLLLVDLSYWGLFPMMF